VLLKLLSPWPTHVKENVPDMPKFAGYYDAAAEGSGDGVWFALEQAMDLLVWKIQFPDDIKNSVVSDKNRTGSITNSDLELAAEVFALAIILRHGPIIKHQALGTLCDNTLTVSWITKMASKANTPISGRLLKELASSYTAIMSAHSSQSICQGMTIPWRILPHAPQKQSNYFSVALTPTLTFSLLSQPHSRCPRIRCGNW